jgi:hypothetical protein
VQGRDFRTDGSVFDQRLAAPASPMGGIFDVVTRALEDVAVRPEGRLVRQYAVFELELPGGARKSFTRTIADEAALASPLGLMDAVTVQPLVAAPGLAALADAYARLVETLAGRLAAELADTALSRPAEAPEDLAGLVPLPVLLFSIYRSVALRADPRLFVAEPNLVLFTQGTRAGGDEEPAFRAGFDLANRPLAAAPGGGSDLMSLQLLAGVRDTLFEALALGYPQERPANAAVALAGASPAGGLNAYRPADRAAFARDVSADAGLLAELDAGNWLLAGPADPANLWRYDPLTGVVLGLGAEGRGAAQLEWLTTVGKIGNYAELGLRFLGLAHCLFAVSSWEGADTTKLFFFLTCVAGHGLGAAGQAAKIQNMLRPNTALAGLSNQGLAIDGMKTLGTLIGGASSAVLEYHNGGRYIRQLVPNAVLKLIER